ncbi:bcl-2-interacting killer [Ochotona princeps]|uniref:bcl-2-interacting killer n=1 Tax=Ochotona princeps TaxID=9978 RepID=UPI00271559FF|nr:bcl-2-interacting killer [Ochotona princeps]
MVNSDPLQADFEEQAVEAATCRWLWHRAHAEMSEVRPGSRDLQEEQVPELSSTEIPGLTRPTEDGDATVDLDLMECLEHSNRVALRLARIGDEMDVRVRGPRLAQLPGMAMHSLALTYSRRGVRGVAASLALRLASLLRFRSRRGAPSPWASLEPMPLLLLLLGGGLLLLLQ